MDVDFWGLHKLEDTWYIKIKVFNRFTLSLRAIAKQSRVCRDCGACSEWREESPGLLRLRLATAELLAMTLYIMRLS